MRRARSARLRVPIYSVLGANTLALQGRLGDASAIVSPIPPPSKPRHDRLVYWQKKRRSNWSVVGWSTTADRLTPSTSTIMFHAGKHRFLRRRRTLAAWDY